MAPTPQQTTFSFTKLPIELRLTIWELALPGPRLIPLVYSSTPINSDPYDDDDELELSEHSPLIFEAKKDVQRVVAQPSTVITVRPSDVFPPQVQQLDAFQPSVDLFGNESQEFSGPQQPNDVQLNGSPQFFGQKDALNYEFSPQLNGIQDPGFDPQQIDGFQLDGLPQLFDAVKTAFQLPWDYQPEGDSHRAFNSPAQVNVSHQKSHICYGIKARAEPIPTPLLHICKESRTIAKKYYSEAFGNSKHPGLSNNLVGGKFYIDWELDTFQVSKPTILQLLYHYGRADGFEFVKTWVRQVRHIAFSGDAVKLGAEGAFDKVFEKLGMFWNLETITLETKMVRNVKGEEVPPRESDSIEEVLQEKLRGDREMIRAKLKFPGRTQPPKIAESTSVKFVPLDTLIERVNKEREDRGKEPVVVDEWYL